VKLKLRKRFNYLIWAIIVFVVGAVPLSFYMTVWQSPPWATVVAGFAWMQASIGLGLWIEK